MSVGVIYDILQTILKYDIPLNNYRLDAGETKTLFCTFYTMNLNWPIIAHVLGPKFNNNEQSMSFPILQYM